MSRIESANFKARQAWDANARFWDERMADGNDHLVHRPLGALLNEGFDAGLVVDALEECSSMKKGRARIVNRR